MLANLGADFGSRSPRRRRTEKPTGSAARRLAVHVPERPDGAATDWSLVQGGSMSSRGDRWRTSGALMISEACACLASSTWEESLVKVARWSWEKAKKCSLMSDHDFQPTPSLHLQGPIDALGRGSTLSENHHLAKDPHIILPLPFSRDGSCSFSELTILVRPPTQTVGASRGMWRPSVFPYTSSQAGNPGSPLR